MTPVRTGSWSPVSSCLFWCIVYDGVLLHTSPSFTYSFSIALKNVDIRWRNWLNWLSCFFSITSSFYGVYQLEEKACVFNDASRNVFSIRLSFFLRRVRSGRKSQDTVKKAFIFNVSQNHFLPHEKGLGILSHTLRMLSCSLWHLRKPLFNN